MKKALTWIILIEFGMAGLFYWRCYSLADCGQTCVPTGNDIASTCFIVGFKVFILLLLPTLIIFGLHWRDLRR